MLYTSIDNKKIKDIKKLQVKKYRDLMGKFIIEGEHIISEANKSGYLDEVLLLDDTDLAINVPVNYVNKSVMKYLSNLDNPTNALGICHKLKAKDYGNRILVLEDIQDPGNLGTIIRSSVAFNVDTIILSYNCVDLYNPKVLRAMQGMLFKINVVVSDIYEELTKLKKDYKILGTKVDGGINVNKLSKDDKIVIIMGNEGNGLSQEVSLLCDNFIYIDMNKDCESLNVGVATSIILYELDK